MRKISAAVILCFLFLKIQAQDRVITVGVPFLLIAADARSASMGDQGVATSPDAFSQQFNPAKYAFSEDKIGFSLNYTPYLTELVNDIALGQITFFDKFNERSAVSASIRYFALGEIELRQNFDDPPMVVKPSEFALDVAYALKLSDKFSMAVGGRFISSNLRFADPTSGGDIKAATSFAVDVAGYFVGEEIAYNSFNGRFRGGFNFQNLGPKISYDIDQNTNNANFLPAQMRLGAGFDFVLDDYNKVFVGLETTKLLVPTPQSPTDLNGDGIIDASERAINNDEYRRIGWTEGIFKSFGDAPDGFSEELKEFTYSIAAEYAYQDSFAFRLGYFNETVEKGARKYATLGAGFKYNVIKIDLSYLFSTSKVKNPLESTLRFSLSFAFGDKYEQY